jgi:hypothetical protein
VYASYIYETVVEENAVHLSVPLPSSLKGGMVTRAHEMYPVENATIFSFNVESAMPGQILDVRSDSHSISTDIELNTATIEVNEPVVPVSVYDSYLLYICFREFQFGPAADIEHVTGKRRFPAHLLYREFFRSRFGIGGRVYRF